MKRLFKQTLSLLLALMFVLLLTACGGGKAEPAAPSQGSAPAAKEVLTVAAGGEPASLDLQTSTIGAGKGVFFAVYDYLFSFNKDTMEIIPLLCESYEWVDSTTFKMKIREGVTSSAGTPFKASDVLFVLGRGAAFPGLGNKYSYLDVANSYTEGDYTVILKLPRPYANLPYLLSLSCFSMYCEADFNKLGADEFARKPVSVGPYVMTEWVAGDHITMERRDDYWGEKGTFKTLVIRFISDVNSRVMALQSGDVDLAEAITYSQAQTIAGTKGLKSITLSEYRIITITCNLNNEPLKNDLVRQAINIGVDKAAIAQAITLGAGQAAEGLFASASPFCDSSVVVKHDPEKAKELLAQAGYPDGFEFTLNVPTFDQIFSDVAQALQGELSKMGIKMTLNTLDPGAFFPALGAPETQAYILYNSGFVPEDALSLLDGANANGGTNNANYINPKFDELYYTSLAEHDYNKRIEYYKQMNELICADLPIISLIEANSMVACLDTLDISPRNYDTIGSCYYTNIIYKP